MFTLLDAAAATGSSLHWIDIALVVTSVVLVMLFGLKFAHKQDSTDSYFAAGGSIPSWAIGMSIFATLISSVTFLSYPGAAYGGNWILLVQGLMVPLVLLGMIWFIVPLFRRTIRLSTYEYFERRFGFGARLYGSLAFLLIHFSKLGTVFYLVALAVSEFMAWDIYWVIVVIGIAVTIITLLGGMEAVIWMDVIQGFILIVGGLICAGILLFAPEGGPSAVMEVALEDNKIGVGPFDWDFVQLTFWVMAINGVFYAIQKYGTDQTIVQRYLTAKDDRAAKKAAYIGVLASVPIWTLFMFIGTCLYAYYKIEIDPAIVGLKADEVFPHFIANELPIGVKGLIVSALLAGAISSLDSDLNCFAAIGVQDYYVRFKPQSTDRQRLNLGRWIVAISGVASIVIAAIYAYWGGEGILGVLFGLYAIFSSGIVGLFLLGLLVPRANKQGLWVGLIVCILFTAYAVLTSTKFTVGVDPETGDPIKQTLLNLGEWNFTHHKYMLGVYSHLIVFFVGWLASYFWPKKQVDESLTIRGYMKARKMEK